MANPTTKSTRLHNHSFEMSHFGHAHLTVMFTLGGILRQKLYQPPPSLSGLFRAVGSGPRPSDRWPKAACPLPAWDNFMPRPSYLTEQLC